VLQCSTKTLFIWSVKFCMWLQIFSGIQIPIIIKISQFLTELFENKTADVFVDRSWVHFTKTHRKHFVCTTFWQRSMRFQQLNSRMSRCRWYSARAWHCPVHTTDVWTQCKTLSVPFAALQIYFKPVLLPCMWGKKNCTVLFFFCNSFVRNSSITITFGTHIP